MQVKNVSRGTLILDDEPKDGWGNILPEIHIYLVVPGKRRKYYGRFACECEYSALLCFESTALEIGVVSSKNN